MTEFGKFLIYSSIFFPSYIYISKWIINIPFIKKYVAEKYYTFAYHALTSIMMCNLWPFWRYVIFEMDEKAIALYIIDTIHYYMGIQ